MTRPGGRAKRTAILTIVLAGALLPAALPAHAQTREGRAPAFGCRTEAAYDDATQLVKAGNRDGFDTLVAREACLLIDDCQFSLVQTNFLKLNAQIRLTTENGKVLLFTSLDTVPPM